MSLVSSFVGRFKKRLSRRAKTLKRGLQKTGAIIGGIVEEAAPIALGIAGGALAAQGVGALIGGGGPAAAFAQAQQAPSQTVPAFSPVAQFAPTFRPFFPVAQAPLPVPPPTPPFGNFPTSRFQPFGSGFIGGGSRFQSFPQQSFPRSPFVGPFPSQVLGQFQQPFQRQFQQFNPFVGFQTFNPFRGF